VAAYKQTVRGDGIGVMGHFCQVAAGELLGQIAKGLLSRIASNGDRHWACMV